MTRVAPSNAVTLTATGVGGAASGLATGAALASTAPVAGWIVGGALATAAGTVAITQAIRGRRVTKQQALRWAKEQGLPTEDARDVAAFTVRLARQDRGWRLRQRSKLNAQLGRVKQRELAWRRRPGARRTLQVFTLGIMRGPARLANLQRRLEAKLRLIAVLEETRQERRAERRETAQEQAQMAAMQQGATTDLDTETETEETPRWVWVAVGGTALVGVALLYKARKGAG